MKNRNSFAEHTNLLDKNRDFNRARAAGAVAYKSDGTTVSLRDVKLSQVEFIAGLWRFQNEFPHPIQRVRDIDVVLGQKLMHQEKNLFEFFQGYRVANNCYGYFISKKPDCIVAKYTTDHGTYWSYGATIEQARAFLGIKLYDEYMDLIHSVACKNMNGKIKK